jgi:hypothetical protein
MRLGSPIGQLVRSVVLFDRGLWQFTKGIRLRIADKIVVLNDRRLIESGTRREPLAQVRPTPPRLPACRG